MQKVHCLCNQIYWRYFYALAQFCFLRVIQETYVSQQDLLKSLLNHLKCPVQNHLECFFQASFLPETVGVALPETVPESAVFGRKQKYFSWTAKPKQDDSRITEISESSVDTTSVKVWCGQYCKQIINQDFYATSNFTFYPRISTLTQVPFIWDDQ